MKNTIYIYPTDTVWGIGGTIHDEIVYNQVARIKETDLTKPVSTLFNSWELLEDYFNFPDTIKTVKSELLQIFKLKTTLGFPVKWIKNNSIPQWIYQNSDVVGVRVLKDSKSINKIIKNEKSAIITTSLNKTGSEPIILKNDAIAFQKNFAKNCEFICEDDYKDPTRSSASTIIFFNEKYNYTIIRKGEGWDNIEKHLALLTTRLL
ncbi:MAG: Sua5/YciO/YrdC/YwlC family protein [Bacteriovoracaceae bacterium]